MKIKSIFGAAGKTTLTAAAAFAAGIGVGHVGGVLTDEDVRYANEVVREVMEDRVIPAHRAAVWQDSSYIENGDTVTVRVAVDSVDVPRRTDRGRMVFRADSAVTVGDTVKVVVLVNNVAYAENVRAITEPAAPGKVLKIYDRLVIWEDTETVDTTEVLP